MKKINSLILTSLLTLFCVQLYAQQTGQLILRTEVKTYTSNLNEFVQQTAAATPDYKLILFNSTPTNSIKDQLIRHGVEMLEYVPNNAFLVKFHASNSYDFLLNCDVLGVYDVPRALKLDYRIIHWDIPQHAKGENDLVKVAIIAMHGLTIQNFAGELAQEQIFPSHFGMDQRFAYCELSKNQIDDIIKKPWVRSVELIDEPGRPESTEGRTLQKSNLINNDLTNGLSFNASGVKVLVRDDGLVGPHIDFEGRLINLTNDATGTHGDGVAGVFAGAGNIDPSVEGGASGADVFVMNYSANFQDTTLALHLNSDVMITNSSYSNGCNDGYTSTTQTVDRHVFDHPTLMHVFSAGNSNNTDCGYGAGIQWGNITGGHKMGKNVITVANLNNDASLVSSSSRGPAHDGRIKPDLAAHGQGQMSTDPNNEYAAFGGTSSAAPSLAGNLAQLVEAYRSLNNNADPKSALIKAAAMNSATDLGNPGPDFRYGYGLINTARAYDIIANNQYLFDTINQGSTKNHTVTVPAGTGQLRIMLYWHDPEATVNTNKALINDLDLVVNNTLLPLVLDPTPNATTLNNPAIPGVDRLNNIEQVVVDNPAAGSYTVQISGYQVPSGPQEYVLVYTFIKDEIKVTYPLGGESLIPGKSERIHWDAYGDVGSFTVAYSTNNGNSWTTIGSATGDRRNLAWTVPSISTGEALIRVSRGSQSDVSDAAFNIFPVPVFNIQLKDTSSVELNWATISGATKYFIWRLGNKYMEIIDSTTTNQYTLGGLMPGENLWLSVSASSATITGERANAKNFIFNPVGSCNGCLSSIRNFPHIESFESGFGLFCQGNNDDTDFTNWSGTTPTSGTGPSFASQGSNYIYVESSNPNNPTKKAILGSPCYDLINTYTAQLKFDYHMLGNEMGTLEIEVSTDGGQTYSAPIWSKTGNQGITWQSDSIDFSSYQNSQVSYRFVVTTGSGPRSDVALDNVIFSAESRFPLSTTDVAKTIQYAISPNPSDGNFYLNTTQHLKSIQVINSFGQTVLNNTMIDHHAKLIDMKGNAPGIYIVILCNENNEYSRLKISLF